MTHPELSLIEDDAFPFEFLSALAERESWRKEVHRPIYHVHKWWAKRLGSVFRGILLGCVLPRESDLATEFYRRHSFANRSVFDPFLGSGTTVGEAHKLGFAALGRDINPVAIRAARTAFGAADEARLRGAFAHLSETVGCKIRSLYAGTDSRGRPGTVLYHFWVMQASCPGCGELNDLFPSWVVARNAYPDRKPEVQLLCPACGLIFPGVLGQPEAACPGCCHTFDPGAGTVSRASAACRHCGSRFKVVDVMSSEGMPPAFRLYGKLLLTESDRKEYLPATSEDREAYAQCSAQLRLEESCGQLDLPTLKLEEGHNTRQAMRYGFRAWRDFFNDRQLLALGWLRRAIREVTHEPTQATLLTLFSGVLEFNNRFASYKGEGTGAVRHMFSHHVLKPERAPIEANVWGTPRSSGAFSTLFESRLMRAVSYRNTPLEIGPVSKTAGRDCSPPFSGRVEAWPVSAPFPGRAIYLSCGDSAATGLPKRSVDLVVTDPPFFDNVHYSELADFFFAWQQPDHDDPGYGQRSTRSPYEVQDADANGFARKLSRVFAECHRVLTDEGLLVFTYHHSREEGWTALARAIVEAGFVVVNSHPVKAELSVATPKSQSKDPIQLDTVLVCRKALAAASGRPASPQALVSAGIAKLTRLERTGLQLSVSDRRVVLIGQLLPMLRTEADMAAFSAILESDLSLLVARATAKPPLDQPAQRGPQPVQKTLF